MDENQLAHNLEVAKITLDILNTRRKGIQANLEGLIAYISHEDNQPLTKEIADHFVLEMKAVLKKGDALIQEYRELAEWTKQNLPKKFHFDTDNL